MSDYFDALIRSSGMALGPGMPATMPGDGPPGGVAPELGLVEIEVQREMSQPMPPPAIALAPPAPLRPASVPSPSGLARASQTRSPEATGAPPTATEVAASVTPAAPPPTPRRPDPGPLPAPASEVAATATTGPPDLRQAMMRAAMRWVAADPEFPASTAPEVTPPPRPSDQDPARRDDPSVRVAGSSAGDGRHAARPTTRPAPPPTRSIVTPVSMPASRGEEAVARTPARTSEPTYLARHDEMVEVSIGAIHVRVDAPAPQTVTAPPPPAAGKRPVAERPPARSGLARRALRRI
jgi:hypothetical protein